MRKSIKILTIIDIIVMIIYCVLKAMIYNTNSFMESLVLSLVVNIPILIVLFLTITMIIIYLVHIKDTTDTSIKQKTIILIIIVLLGNILCPVYFILEDKKEEKLVEKEYAKLTKKANKLIDSIKKIENNKYVYFYDDLKEIDSELVSDLDKESFIAYYEGKARVCISKDPYRLEGDESNYTTIKNTKKSNCKYSFIGDEDDYYLKYYINNKYDLDVKKVKVNTSCNMFGSCSIVNYTIDTNEGSITVSLNVNNNKIVVEDNYPFVYASKLLQEELTKYLEDNNYTTKVFVTDGESQYKDISNIDISNLNNDLSIDLTIIIKKDNRSEEDMKPIANQVGDWYKDHTIYGEIKFLLLENEEYEKLTEEEYNSSSPTYDVNSFITCEVKKDGQVIIN